MLFCQSFFDEFDGRRVVIAIEPVYGRATSFHATEVGVLALDQLTDRLQQVDAHLLQRRVAEQVVADVAELHAQLVQPVATMPCTEAAEICASRGFLEVL